MLYANGMTKARHFVISDKTPKDEISGQTTYKKIPESCALKNIQDDPMMKYTCNIREYECVISYNIMLRCEEVSQMVFTWFNMRSMMYKSE